jgi:uncharacterized protein YjiS (DUF1127 family)
VRDPGRRRDPLDREPAVVDPLAAPVLDRAAGEPGRERAAHGLRDLLRRVAEAVLEVGRDRQRRRRRDLRRMRERLLARDVAVEPAERRGEAAARRRERIEAERRQ